MHITILAAVSPVNSPHGYNWTFAFPMLMFVVIAGTLYLILSRPHKVPGHGTLAPVHGGQAQHGPGAAVAPEGETALAAAVATGFTTASGGGAGESAAEPGGAHRAANIEPEDSAGAVQLVPGQDAAVPAQPVGGTAGGATAARGPSASAGVFAGDEHGAASQDRVTQDRVTQNRVTEDSSTKDSFTEDRAATERRLSTDDPEAGE